MEVAHTGNHYLPPLDSRMLAGSVDLILAFYPKVRQRSSSFSVPNIFMPYFKLELEFCNLNIELMSELGSYPSF